MYWPTSAARVLGIPLPLNNSPIVKVRPSRKGNFFAILTEDGLGIWDVRVSFLLTFRFILALTAAQPTVLQAAVKRTASSVERWGGNVDVVWGSDGRGIIILVSRSMSFVLTNRPPRPTCYSIKYSRLLSHLTISPRRRRSLQEAVLAKEMS